MTALPAGLTVAAYQPDMAEDWDRMVADSVGGTLLHTRRFLDYHGDRFSELSTVLLDGSGAMAGIFPIVASPKEMGVAVSHAGSSFGGVVTRSVDPGSKWHFLRATAGTLCAAGYRRMRYKTTPAACLGSADDALLPMLLHCGKIVACDLWSVVTLRGRVARPGMWGHEIRRGERKNLSIETVSGITAWQEFHELLRQRLLGKFGVAPTHTAVELCDLERRLGSRQRGIIVREPGGKGVAALWFLDYGTGTLHMQYSATTQEGLRLGAAPFAVSHVLKEATAASFGAFSFGRSTDADGWSVNYPLLRFKEQFGATLSAQFHIDVDLCECVRQPDDFLMREA